MLAQAHGSTSPPQDTHHLDVRRAEGWADLLRGVDVVCHQAALVGAGVRIADLPLYAAHNDLGTAALLAAMTAAGVDRMVLASSMVVYGEGRYACAEHGEQVPAPRSRDALDSGRFDNPCGSCGRLLGWMLVEADARLGPRSAYAASQLAQEHYSSAWARQADGAVTALRYHNVYGPGMPKNTPYSGVAAMFRSSTERGEPPRVFEDGGQMRDFGRRRRAGEPRRSRRRRGGGAWPPSCVQRLLRRADLDPAGRGARRCGHGKRPGSAGHPRVPVRRRAAHRRVAGEGG